MNLFLIGYRGTGKSTVARLVAEKLGWQSTDADVEIERRAGKMIAEIFHDDGETAFRDLESQVVRDLAASDQCVIALGGGAPLREENRRALAERGPVIWLQAAAETIYDRITNDVVSVTQRPNLTSSGGLSEIQELLTHREPIYHQLADFTVDTESKTPVEVAVVVTAWLDDVAGEGERGRGGERGREEEKPN